MNGFLATLIWITEHPWWSLYIAFLMYFVLKGLEGIITINKNYTKGEDDE